MPHSDLPDIGNSLDELNEDVIKALHILSGFSYSKVKSYPSSEAIETRYSWENIRPTKPKQNREPSNEINRSELIPFKPQQFPDESTAKVLLEIRDQFLAYAVIDTKYLDHRYTIAVWLYELWLSEQDESTESSYNVDLEKFQKRCEAQTTEKDLFEELLTTVANELEATRIHLFLRHGKRTGSNLEQEIKAHFRNKEEYTDYPEVQKKGEDLEKFYDNANENTQLLKLVSAVFNEGQAFHFPDWSTDTKQHHNQFLEDFSGLEKEFNTPHKFPIFRFLFGGGGLGGQTLQFLNEVDQINTALSDANLISPLKQIDHEGNFANFKLTQEEKLNSQMMVALVDEFQGKNNVLGVMKIFSVWQEPLFTFKQNKVISMVKEAVQRLMIIRAKKYVQHYEGELSQLDPVSSAWDAEAIEKGVEDLQGFQTWLDRLDNHRSVIDYQYLERELAYRRNCHYNFRLEEISIKNANLFGNTEWEFHKRLNVLVGKNGYGKSYLFRLLLAMATQDEQHIRSYLQKNKVLQDRATALTPDIVLSVTQLEKKKEEDQEGPEEIVSNISIHRDLNKYHYCVDGKKERFPVGYIPILAIPDIRFTKRAAFVPGVGMPFDGDLKRIGAKAFLDGGDFQNMVGEFLSELCINFFMLKDQYLRENSTELQDSEAFEIEPYAELKKVVQTLTEYKQFRFESIQKKESESGFEFLVYLDENNPRVPIQQLSQGMISIMAIVGIIFRYLKSLHYTNPETFTEVKDELKGILIKKGIVFIDEIDAHLHPMIQLTILGELTENFSGVQFFVSSHSPLVVIDDVGNGDIQKLTKKKSGLALESMSITLEDAFLTVLEDIFELDSAASNTRNKKGWDKLKKMLEIARKA